ISLSEQSFFETALKAGKPYLSPAFILPQAPFSAMIMTRPLGQGMVLGHISLEPLRRILGGVKIGDKGYAAITDREGMIIAHSDPSFAVKPPNVKHLPMVSYQLAGKKEAFHYDFRGEEMLGCVAVVPETGWQLMVVQPLSEAFAPVARMRNIFLRVVLLSVLLALGIAFFSRRKIVRPFQRLIIDAGKIAKGDYHISPHEKGYPEIDALSDNFRAMAVSLKAREVSLQQSEEKYRNLVEDSFDGIFIQKGPRIIFANQRLHEMLGYESGELVGLNHWVVYHPDYRYLTQERARARMRGETVTPRYEVKLQRKEGSWFFGEIYAKMIQLEGEPGIQAWLTDLSHRKEAEAAVLQSEKRFRDLFNAISDLIYTQDLEGRFLSANPAMCSLFGYDLNEFLGRKASDFMDPELRPYFKTEYLEKLKSEGKYQGTSGYTAKDGRRILIEYHSTLVRSDDGEPYISGMGRDVTEKVQGKKQLKLLREQIVQAEKMKAVGVLAGGVAHDFNNLLMGIQGNASLMLLTAGTHHAHYERLKNIEKYVQQGADLTRQLLGFAREGKYEVKPTDINRLLEDELRLFLETHKELFIQKHYQEGIWTVDVDRSQIIQALMNLFINAWQAMPGGGELHVQTQNVALDEHQGHFYQVDSGKYVKISIRDSGVGMDETTLDRIFEPFFTTKEMGRGTGLGLASVYGTIKNHGGFTYVESSPGKGTSFYVHLPASMSALEETIVISSSQPLQGKGENILLVDDEEMVLEVGGAML
ncbi:MAG TPA: PAS domain S-box protein, partial [Desulfobacteria bacterium]|nr:PAS domain S-box protein [Desulfobacteria bacterium]